MKLIYVVTNGEYEDYHICGVFSDKEKAEALYNNLKTREESWRYSPCPKIEVFTLDEVAMDE